MIQAISLDSNTLIIKADNENDLNDIMGFIAKKDKQKSLDTLLKFASENRTIEKEYKFDRNECYDR